MILMASKNYVCKRCRKLFRGVEEENLAKVICPMCGKSQAIEAPIGKPANSDSGKEKSTTEYECQQCHNVFNLPGPASPSREKDINCPNCNSTHIHRLTPPKGEPLHCN
jgi:DNA-directed RNA polymerase subunit RPC12/RpoP